MAGLIGSHATVVSSGAERKKHYNITTTTTSLTGLQYTPTKVHVYHNGVRLVDGTDYTATNGTSITLTNAAENGDDVVVISYATFQVSDTVSKTTGGTFEDAITIDADGATVLTVDRATSDGTIIDVQKGGTTVGSIGTSVAGTTGEFGIVSSTGQLILGTTTNNKHLQYDNDSLYPSVDNANDLGYSTLRFKDLYLSGGVYLGGTGSSNKLDDYEEGTFTPAMSGSTGGSFTVGGNSRSYYRKVGGLVTVNTMIQWTGNTSTGSLRITGLPFAALNTDSYYRTGAALGYVSGADVDGSNFRQLVGTMSGGGTQVDFFLLQDNTSPTTSDAAQWSSSGEIQFSVTYMTNS